MKKLKKLLLGALTVMSLACVASACSVGSSSAHEHSYESSVTKQATCTETGIRTFRCGCGDNYTEAIVALGHDRVQAVAKASTCVSRGWDAYEYCTRCDYSTKELLPLAVNNHDFMEHDAKASTCLSPGWDAYEYCSRCDYTTYKELPATGHTFIKGVCTDCGSKDHEHEWDEGIVTTAPTCLLPGVKTYTCWCTGTKTEAVDALGHDKVQHEAQKATCTAIGWEAYKTCSRCDYTTYVEIAALGHDYQGAICSRCQAIDPDCISEGLAFELSVDGKSYEVLGIGSCKDTEIVIPSIYNELPVTRIGNRAFSRCSSLTRVVIPDSVTEIGGNAFVHCSGLTSVVIPDSVIVIDESAFNNCGLTMVVIPDSVKSIGRFAFACCSSLTSVVIPDSVTEIGDSAFVECSSLTNVAIPDSVTAIGDDAFAGCSSLTSIEVSENNKKYKSIDGNLYSKDGTTLIQYAIGKTATSFTVPDSVTDIGRYAFCACDGLTSVTIGNGVTGIGDMAFAVCSSLTSITFNGTKGQWEAMEKGSNWKENSAIKTVVCTDGTIDLE